MIELDVVIKYGSIIVPFIMLFSQIFNVQMGINVNLSLISIFINIFFLMVVLTKLEILVFSFLQESMDKILKIMILVFILNSVAYFLSTIQIHNYFFAPLNFLGAYFIFMLRATK